MIFEIHKKLVFYKIIMNSQYRLQQLLCNIFVCFGISKNCLKEWYVNKPIFSWYLDPTLAQCTICYYWIIVQILFFFITIFLKIKNIHQSEQIVIQLMALPLTFSLQNFAECITYTLYIVFWTILYVNTFPDFLLRRKPIDQHNHQFL